MKRIKSFFSFLVVVFLFAGCTYIPVSNEPMAENMTVHFLDVGQGNAIFVEGPEGQTMLFDAGGDGDVGKQIVDYIKKRGYDSLDIMIITHPHADHMNGAPYVLEQLRVGAVYHPKVTHTTKLFEDFVEVLKKKNLSLIPAQAGIDIPFGKIQAKILGPISSTYENLNNYSVVVRLDAGEFSVLLTGDIEALAEEELLKGGIELQSDILQIPHHGSNTSSTQAFLDDVNPKYSIISLASDNKYGHPHTEVQERLLALDTEVLRTDEYGTIVLTYKEDQILVKTEKDGKNSELNQPYIDPNTGQGLIKGNKNSKIYHMPGGANYNSVQDNNIIWFTTEREAIKAGYRKSKR